MNSSAEDNSDSSEPNKFTDRVFSYEIEDGTGGGRQSEDSQPVENPTRDPSGLFSAKKNVRKFDERREYFFLDPRHIHRPKKPIRVRMMMADEYHGSEQNSQLNSSQNITPDKILNSQSKSSSNTFSDVKRNDFTFRDRELALNGRNGHKRELRNPQRLPSQKIKLANKNEFMRSSTGLVSSSNERPYMKPFHLTTTLSRKVLKEELFKDVGIKASKSHCSRAALNNTGLISVKLPAYVTRSRKKNLQVSRSTLQKIDGNSARKKSAPQRADQHKIHSLEF